MLSAVGIDLAAAVAKIKRLLGSRCIGRLNNSAVILDRRSKRVLDFADGEASEANSAWIGMEHLLFGLLREENGPTALVFQSLAADLEKARAAVDSLTVPGAANGVVPEDLPLPPEETPQVDQFLRPDILPAVWQRRGTFRWRSSRSPTMRLDGSTRTP